MCVCLSVYFENVCVCVWELFKHFIQLVQRGEKIESEDNVFVLMHMSGKIIYFELEFEVQHASVCGCRSWQQDWSGKGKKDRER